jgi:glycosyltransferase involved in cell wall biosynthesis
MRPLALNWFSPLRPAPTGIATYTEVLLPALSERFNIRLWTEQKAWNPAIERWAVVRRYDPNDLPTAELRKADVTVYNFGNDQRFHAGIWQVSQRYPGVVALHDARLHHMFLGAFRHRWNDRDGYVRLLEKYYGPSVHEAARDSWQGTIDTDAMAIRWPLTEAAVDNALVVIVHNGAVARQVREYGHRPVRYVPLPHAPVSPRQSRRPPTPPYRLLIFGHLGTNRRVESLLQAWGELPERDQFRLDIAGEPWNRSELMTLIRKHNLYRHVFVHGFVSDAKLDTLLDRADLGINLRFPTMGEASASLLRMWAHALPAMVTRVGWYAALPQGSVVSVRQDHEIADIQLHLRRFAKNPQEFLSIGFLGHQHVIKRHTPDKFAAALHQLTTELNHQQLARSIHRLAGTVAGEIAGWELPQNCGGFTARVADHLQQLFGETEKVPE